MRIRCFILLIVLAGFGSINTIGQGLSQAIHPIGGDPTGVIQVGKVHIKLPPVTTNLLGYWDQSYGIEIDSSIILRNAGYNPVDTIKINNVDFSLASGYIPLKTTATLQAVSVIPVDTQYFGSVVKNIIYPTTVPANVDYNNRIFFNVSSQVLNSDLTENKPARITEIIVYSNAKTGSDSTTLASYVGTTAIPDGTKWIDPVNGSDAAAGTRIAPYKTFATAIAATSTGGTIFIKSGSLNASCIITNKGVTIKGVGNTKNIITTSYAFLFQTNSTQNNYISNIVIDGGVSIGVRTTNTGASNTYLSNMVITSNNSIYNTSYVATANTVVKNCILSGQTFVYVDNLFFESNIVKRNNLVIPVISYSNLTSKYNIYKGSNTTIIQRKSATTSISLFNDDVTGSLFTDENITTIVSVTVNKCNLKPNATGNFLSLINASSKVSFNIINNNILQAEIPVGLGFYIMGYDINFTGNTLISNNNTTISGKALSDDKIFTFGNNKCTNDSSLTVLSYNYKFIADSNIIVSGRHSSFQVKSINYDSLYANIFNNYMVSKKTGSSFVLIGTEYDSTKNGFLSGSDIYNNRFSGPGDFGNTVGPYHGLFCWSNQASWHHNYISGVFLAHVMKSDGGTYANAIHHEVIKNCTASATIKGIKGTLYYNNTSYNSGGYDGLPESYPKLEGNSGNSTIKNNIFYDTDSDNAFVMFESDADSIGCESDSNVFYNAALTKIGRVTASNYTLTQWQVLGFDLGSLDADPNFTSTTQLWPVTPFTGVNLGAAYDDGLDISTTWGNSTTVPHVVTKQQGATWQIGAYIK